ncbi:hypothetical protein ACHAWC_005021 [Mediolabrus comicus]
MATIKKKRPSYARRRSSSSLSASMTENTLLPLASLIEKPGLAFYTAYAHVEDVSSHLMSLLRSGGGSDKYSLSTLASCILSSQELLLGLLYRTDICDQRPGVDKLALGLAVKDILCQFNSLLTIAAAVDMGEDNMIHHDSKVEREEEKREDQNGGADKTSPTPTSFFCKLAAAQSLGLLSLGTKEAISSSLKIMNDNPPINKYVFLDNNTRTSLDQLNSTLGDGSGTFSSTHQDSCNVENYSNVALKVPSLVLKSHENANGGVDASSHGPEDYIFQITHVILEHFFWYVEKVLFPQSSLLSTSGKGSNNLIIMQYIFESCTKVLGVLDYMILADFHPLRVAVHGSSGFYSQAWHRIRAWFVRTFKETTTAMNLDHVHICPEMYPNETLYLQRLDRASSAFRTMCFRHYTLAERTIGSNSMGSAGKSFEQMQGSFLRHPCGEYNAAKYRVHEYTNVKCAEFVGLGTQAVIDDAKASAGHDNDEALDKIGYVEEDEHEQRQLSNKLLTELERCFVDSNVEAFLDLFNTSNCRIEHPLGTLPYLGKKVKAYFQNLTKRHPTIHSFKCSSEAAGKITINVDADLSEGTRVQYLMRGDCILDENGLILRLLVSGLPDMSEALCENNDQRNSFWTTRESWLKDDCQSLQQSYRRQLSPAEMLAFQLNQNKSGKNVSDGLTIVSRSLIQGQCTSRELVQNAIDQVVNRHMLLKARVEVTESGHYFVVDGECDRQTSIEIIDGARSRLDCEKYLNFQFDCENGQMIRVIISRFQSSFELVTVMYHGVCDAISARDLHYQFIRQLAAVDLVASGKQSDCLQVLNEMQLQASIPLPATHHAKRVLNERGGKAADPLPPPQPVPIAVPNHTELSFEETPRSIAITVKLSKDETDALLAACRDQHTTVHSAIGAASLLAADCGDSRKRVLTSAVDLRRRLQMPTGELVYSVGGFDGSAGFEYDLDEVGEFWSLCQAIRSDIVDSIDSGRLLTTYVSSIEGMVGAYKAGYLDGGCFGTVFLSNIGNEHYQKQHGDLHWLEFDYIYGQFLPGGPHYHITCGTFDGKLTLNFQCVQPTIPMSEAKAFVDSTVNLLKKNSECSQNDEHE